METKFGRNEENWYLEQLDQNQKVKYDNGVINGTGKIVGCASESVAVLGKGYIIEPDISITNETYPWTHFVCFEVHLEKI